MPRPTPHGGITAGALFEIMGRLFAVYITNFPTYTLLYGTFSVVPIFLLWVYFSWMVVLFGAVVRRTRHVLNGTGVLEEAC